MEMTIEDQFKNMDATKSCASNKKRWERFLSHLTPTPKYLKQRGETVPHKDTLVGPNSISKMFALKINPTFELDRDNLESSTRSDTLDNSSRRSHHKEDEDISFIKYEAPLPNRHGSGDSRNYQLTRKFQDSDDNSNSSDNFKRIRMAAGRNSEDRSTRHDQNKPRDRASQLLGNMVLPKTEDGADNLNDRPSTSEIEGVNVRSHQEFQSFKINPTFELVRDNLESSTRSDTLDNSSRRSDHKEDEDISFIKYEAPLPNRHGSGDSRNYQLTPKFQDSDDNSDSSDNFKGIPMAAVRNSEDTKHDQNKSRDPVSQLLGNMVLPKTEDGADNLNDRPNTSEIEGVDIRSHQEFQSFKINPTFELVRDNLESSTRSDTLDNSSKRSHHKEDEDISFIKYEAPLPNRHGSSDSENYQVSPKFQDSDDNSDSSDNFKGIHMAAVRNSEDTNISDMANIKSLLDKKTTRIPCDTKSEINVNEKGFGRNVSIAQKTSDLLPVNQHQVSTYVDSTVEVDSHRILPSSSFPLKAVRPKLKPRMRASVAVDHRSTSVSKWDLNMFTDYVNFDEHVERLNIDTDGVHDEQIQPVSQETLKMFQTSQTEPVLKNVLLKEADVRIFLTAILQNICTKQKIGLRNEELVNLKYLPTCTYDFLFYTHDGTPIGCMEAKTPFSMSKNAFAQAAIQLFVLQQLACKHDVDISTVPVFNILSDGQRFVLIQVKGEKLRLEHVKTKNGDDVLNIRTTNVMESLNKLIQMTLTCLPKRDVA